MEMPKYVVKAFILKEVKYNGTKFVYEETEAIPIQFLKEWSEQNEYDETKPKTIPLVLSDWEDWRKENGK